LLHDFSSLTDILLVLLLLVVVAAVSSSFTDVFLCMLINLNNKELFSFTLPVPCLELLTVKRLNF
jgi:hypothetical protein